MIKHNLKVIFVLIFVLIIALSLTIWLKNQNSQEILKDTVATFSNEPGELPYTDLVGNPVSLDKYLGKVLVVQTWASWSPFTQTDMEVLDELAKPYSPEKVVFLAINRKETKEQAMRYLSTVPNIVNVVIILDPRDRFYSAVGGYAMPETVIYNQKGEIVRHLRGQASAEEISTTLNEITIN